VQLEHQLFYKMVPYDASARVPLLFASPALSSFASASSGPLGGGRISHSKARVVHAPVTLLDIFPTLLSMAAGSAAVPAFADGYLAELMHVMVVISLNLHSAGMTFRHSCVERARMPRGRRSWLSRTTTRTSPCRGLPS
jgi:hypothetical protein